MADRHLSDKALVNSLADSDSIVVVLANRNNRRITVANLKTLLAELPAVTAADNGKSLEVVGGAWATVQRTWTGTQAQYDALGTYDPNVTYYIVEAAS